MKRALQCGAITIAVLGWLTGWPTTLARAEATESNDSARAEFFEQHVRPVLAENCFACHGAKKQEAGLRLDSRAALDKGSDNGPVVDWKNPAASRLLKAIGYADDQLQMPPDPPGKLPQAAIDAIGQWIADGGYWPADVGISSADEPHARHADHWSFQAIRPQELPAVNDASWPKSPIDRFVLARLEEQGMAPSASADRTTLIRRASYDLVGLPPSEQQVAEFLADPAPDAFARLVDRLLDSPRYGERWGRYWLDVARYGETKGYVRLAEERRFLYAFTYRDYVIRALNEDLPYDRFIVEQLAADLLPPGSDRGALAALGFLTLGRQFTGNQHDVIDDRIDVVTRGLLGLTVTCARCHDHKYDPISTADYYSLYGVFASSEEPIVPPLVVGVASDAASRAFQQEFETRKQALDGYEATQHAALVEQFRERASEYLVCATEGRKPPQQPLPKAAGEIRQVVVERWIETIERAGPQDAVWGPWHAFAALKSDAFAAQAAQLVARWQAEDSQSSAPRFNRKVRGRFFDRPPASMADVARAYGELLSQVHKQWRDACRSATAAATAEPDRLADPDDEALRRVLYAPDAAVAVRMQEALWEYLYDAPTNDEIVKRRNAVNEHLAKVAEAPPRAHALVELAKPYEPRIFVRGNPTRPAKRVPRQFLPVISQGEPRPFATGGRLELARAIADPQNPLAARVLVNRVWAHHFGTGLVRTPSNFGTRGALPTHPELLDYLAKRFMDEGWSIKKLHRWIMLSSTYGQQSADRDDYLVRDPENRLLWKVNRRRLDFEALRDSLLVAAGRLEDSAGGPSVELSSPDSRRRSVYGQIDRQNLPGMLTTFDFASPDTHSPERYLTTVPRQSLFLMNSPLVLSAAKDFAARPDLPAREAVADRVARMIRLAWSRTATAREVELGVTFIKNDSTAEEGQVALDPWQAFAQALLLSNEFVYVD
jgi:hypothetical protein